MIADSPAASVPRLSRGTVPGALLSSSNDQPARLTGAAPRFVISMYSPAERTGLYIHSVILTVGGGSSACAAVGSAIASAVTVVSRARGATAREMPGFTVQSLTTPHMTDKDRAANVA